MINNWQEIAVMLLLVLCAVRIALSIYTFFRRTKENANPCANCTSGCELKQLYEQKRADCSHEKKKTKKSCCG